MNVGDTIFYLRENRLHSAPILSKVVVENLHEDWDCTPEQKDSFLHFGPGGTRFCTCHGVVDENEAYETPEALFLGMLEGTPYENRE